MPEPDSTVWVYNPSGRVTRIRKAQLDDALTQGYALPESEEKLLQDKRYQDVKDEQSGALGQVGGFLEGTTSALTAGGLDLLAAQDATPEQLQRMRARRETAGGQLGEAVGTIAPAVMSGGAAAPAGLLARGAAQLGRGAAAATTKAAGKGVAGRIAAKGVELGVEGAAMGAYDQARRNVTDASLGDEELTAEKLLMDVPEAMGYGAAFGGILGLGGAATAEAAKGLGRVLRGGKSTVESADAVEELSASTIDIDPFDELQGVTQAAKGAKRAADKVRRGPILDKAIDGYVEAVGAARGVASAERKVLKDTLKSPNARKDFLARNALRKNLADRVASKTEKARSKIDESSERFAARTEELENAARKAQSEADDADVVFRATDKGYTGKWSNWSTERETAEAYMEEGVGHGGGSLIEGRASGKRLDIRDDTTGVDFERLADELGYDEPSQVAREWRDNGWMYPWEESKDVASKLEASDFDWIEYLDDYPEGATTLVRVSDDGLATGVPSSVDNVQLEALARARSSLDDARSAIDDLDAEQHLAGVRSVEEDAHKSLLARLDSAAEALDEASLSGGIRDVDDLKQSLLEARAELASSVERIAPTNVLDDLSQQESQGFFGQYPMAAALATGVVLGPGAYVGARAVNTLAKPATLARQVAAVESMAERVSRIDNQMTRAVRGALNVSRKAKSKAKGLKSPSGGATAAAVMLSSDRSKSKKSFKRVRRNIETLAAEPKQQVAAVERITSGIIGLSPSLSSSLAKRHVETVQYLKQQLPQPPSYMRTKRQLDEWEPSPTQVTEFARKYRAVTDPLSVVRDVQDGTLTLDAVTALREARPRLYAEMRKVAMLELFEAKKDPSYSSTVQLSILFDFPGDATMTPAFLRRSAERWAAREEQEPPPQQPQGSPAPQVAASAMNEAEEIVASL